MFSFKKFKNGSRPHFDEASTNSSSTISGSRSSSFDHPLSPPPDSYCSKQTNVLVVGQVYEDTILTVDEFPDQDTRTRTNNKQQECGGRGVYTAKVLAQFPKMTPYIMSSIGPKESNTKLISELESKGVKTSTCFYRKTPTPSSYIIQCKNTSSRTVISYNT
jgi:ketohexokinase